MSKVADSLRRGLEQAVAYAKGQADLRGYRVRIDERAIRTRLGMTLEEFAGRLGFSATRAYLLVIDRTPRPAQKARRAA
jgi:putative transcriptional regulator